MSFAMAVFIIVPTVAPALGQGILWLGGWRAIFAAILAIGAIALVWFALRQPETLPAARRLPFSPRDIGRAALEVLRTRAALGYTLATACVFAPFLAYLSSAQQIFQDAYRTCALFPLWFGVLALAFDGLPPFWLFMAYLLVAFFCIGLLFGNLNALAMKPLGHIAGVGAAVVASLTTFIGVPLGALVGQSFDGTMYNQIAAFAVFGAGTLAATRWAEAPR